MLGWLITVSYFVISGITYIKILPDNYRRARANAEKDFLYEYNIEHYARVGGVLSAGTKALFWVYPWFIETPLRKLNAYAWKPIEEEKERRRRLEQDRDDWYKKSLNSTDPEERRMSRDIWKVLDETLKGK